MARLRRAMWWVLVGFGPVIAVLPVIDLLRHPYPFAVTLLAGAALAIVTAQHVRWMRDAMRGLGKSDVSHLELATTFAIALAAWGYMVSQTRGGALWLVLPAAVIAVGVVLVRTSLRWPVVVGGTLVTAAVGMAGVAWGVTDAAPWRAALATVIVIPSAVFAYVFQVWLWDVVLEVDRSRAAAGALAVAEERLRFAADLHDIQGHHLQAIALKAELAERLVGRDDDAARANAHDVAELARTALQETREVVLGYRRASLQTEIGNAVGILRAAGIEATVSGEAVDVPAPLQPLFAALVREGTTNVLRHSDATRCILELSTSDGKVIVRLRNNGVRRKSTMDGSGLAGLRERFADLGGQVQGEIDDDGWFDLVGRAVDPARRAAR
ncbi:two-component system sensor histidine kinase DesK [Herbihabitans rhizosphaerae]|uniref:Two-component system sensor histidine kinase DesK n=2 Tax=Herbihabitans rhizosphaerae TaxID=1872711 RepID=A0A4Q7L2N8_9PSEU|nr:two-component system sensor histidine kinase DesK [Herbihabitans rhizosphaerae]